MEIIRDTHFEGIEIRSGFTSYRIANLPSSNPYQLKSAIVFSNDKANHGADKAFILQSMQYQGSEERHSIGIDIFAIPFESQYNRIGAYWRSPQTMAEEYDCVSEYPFKANDLLEQTWIQALHKALAAAEKSKTPEEFMAEFQSDESYLHTENDVGMALDELFGHWHPLIEELYETSQTQS